MLIVWDLLFGTRRAPEPARAADAPVGLPELEVAQDYASHLRLPFVWKRLHEEGPAETDAG